MSDDAPPGLRERKKLKLRSKIQATAIELFVAQGYNETTLQQVAAAAEVAPRTLYRYFPTKASLVITDEDDARMFERFRAELVDHPPVQALRRSFQLVLAGLDADDFRRRSTLIAAHPELQAALLRNGIGVVQQYAAAIVESTGHPEDLDLAISLTSAAFGIALVTVHWGAAGAPAEQMQRLDRRLAGLEHGFKFA